VKDNSDGVHSGAQRHANCFDQGFRCFARIHHEIANQINYPKFTSIQLLFQNCKAAHATIFLVMQKQYWWNAYTGHRRSQGEA